MPAGKARLKEIVDEHLHREGYARAWLEVEVADRTAKGGSRVLKGGEISGASGGFLDLDDGGRVPFHRVREVRSRGEVLYSRPA